MCNSCLYFAVALKMSGQGMVKAKLQFAEVWYTFCVMEIDNVRDHTLP